MVPAIFAPRSALTAMIQRIQSIYLLLAALCGGLTFLLPWVRYQREGMEYLFSSRGLYTLEGNEVTDAAVRVPFAVLFGVAAAACLGFMFLYKNRPRQIRLVGFVNMLLLALCVFIFITDRSIQALLSANNQAVEVNYSAGLLLPVFMLLFSQLAVRAIRKDEALVRSTDRIR